MNSRRLRALRPTLAESKTAIALSLFMLLLFASFIIYVFFSDPLGPISELEKPRIPAYFSDPQDAAPFPATLDPILFESGPIRDAYSAAKQWPEVLVQQPCYCPESHLRSLLDCFAGFDATSCVICVNEATLAARLHQQGKTASEIRATIIRQYTPTSASQRR
jgi:hypothetical protein